MQFDIDVTTMLCYRTLLNMSVLRANCWHIVVIRDRDKYPIYRTLGVIPLTLSVRYIDTEQQKNQWENKEVQRDYKKQNQNIQALKG